VVKGLLAFDHAERELTIKQRVLCYRKMMCRIHNREVGLQSKVEKLNPAIKDFGTIEIADV
jgi:hypothetical protein